MKWFKKMITRWVREDWDSVGHAMREEKIMTARVSTLGPDRGTSFNIEGPTGLNITVMPAIGGKVITFRHYDRRKDDSQFRHYVIPDDLDFERELGKMITLESLRQG
jgi:hypothetical protein